MEAAVADPVEEVVRTDARVLPPGATLVGMIVVVGNPILRRSPDGKPPGLAGIGALAALAAARAGAQVQLVGRAGDDIDGDAVVLALAGAGIGHAALLRARVATPVMTDPPEPAVGEPPDEGESIAGSDPGLDPADVDLALRYLPDFRVLVVAPEVTVETAVVADRAAAWMGATSIRLVRDPDAVSPPDGPDGTIVLGAPAHDPDGAFATLVGALAAAIDGGEDAATAFRAVIATSGWESAAED